MDLSHRNAFELLQRSLDGRLDAGEQAELERHMATCAECQADAALYRRLEKQAPAYFPATVPSQEEIQQTIRKTRARHRRWRMFKRLSSPVRTAAWAAAAAALVLGVIWIFNTVSWDSQTGTPEVTRIFETVVEQVEVTRVAKETVIEQVEVTRVVKETVIEQVEVTPVFDAEAEEKAVLAVDEAIRDGFAKGDDGLLMPHFHKDYTGFYSHPEFQTTYTFQDLDPDEPNEPVIITWTERNVITSPDLAVIVGKNETMFGDVGPGPYAFTEVYRKVDGQWKLIHTHASFMP